MGNSIKITSSAYTEFLKVSLQAWLKKKTVTFRQKVIFIHNTTPAHDANETVDYFGIFMFKNNWLMP